MYNLFKSRCLFYFISVEGIYYQLCQLHIAQRLWMWVTAYSLFKKKISGGRLWFQAKCKFSHLTGQTACIALIPGSAIVDYFSTWHILCAKLWKKRKAVVAPFGAFDDRYSQQSFTQGKVHACRIFDHNHVSTVTSCCNERITEKAKFGLWCPTKKKKTVQTSVVWKEEAF